MDQLDDFVKKVVIGIISYFPDDQKLKAERINRLNRLIQQCNYLFTGVDLMIIAQNWTGVSLAEHTTNSKITIYTYKNGLGINKARQVLREKFLESDYE